MKFLVVDDSRVMRRIVVRTLRQSGVAGEAIIEAEDGADGLDRAHKDRPDLILSEWRLPDMEGVDFLAALRRHDCHAPLGFLTSHGSAATRAEAEAAGALFVVAKPLTSGKVDAILDAILDAAPQRGTVHGLDRPGHPAASTEHHHAAVDSLTAAPEWALTALPSRKAVRDTVEALLGKTVKAGDGDRVTLDPVAGAVTVGTVVDDQERLAAVICADLPLTVHAGACLGLFPTSVTRDLLAERTLTDGLCENFHAVLDVLASTFNGAGYPYVRLGEVYTDPDTMPPRVLLAIKSLARRDDVRLDVAGYGSGNLSLVLAEG